MNRFRPMNSTFNDSLLSTSNCSLPNRVYTSGYLVFKLLNATYLRLLIGPAILLNLLCLFVLSRPRLSSKSTTIVFLRFLAIFDILAITLKYTRAEINYQSTEKGREVFLLVPAVCKTLYVLMNASISIAMWTIVLMSLDKAVAVSYPLKSSIWVTQKRAFYICCCTIIILLTANLSFISLSEIRLSRVGRKYCGLSEASFFVDLLTASILPMGLITTANIIIAVVLHRVSNVSFNWSKGKDSNGRRDSDQQSLKHHPSSSSSFRFRPSGGSPIATADISLATKRRTSVQVTRMLLAVTLTLIVCNTPNTIYFFAVKIYDTRKLLSARECTKISDNEISLYKWGFYSSVMQDILSDLPHIVNFFLYCLAGRKFRSIFIDEVHNFLVEIHLIKRKPRHYTNAISKIELPTLTGNNSSIRQQGPKTRKSCDVLYNGKSSTTILIDQNSNSTKKRNNRYQTGQKGIHSCSTIR